MIPWIFYNNEQYILQNEDIIVVYFKKFKHFKKILLLSDEFRMRERSDLNLIDWHDIISNQNESFQYEILKVFNVRQWKFSTWGNRSSQCEIMKVLNIRQWKFSMWDNERS